MVYKLGYAAFTPQSFDWLRWNIYISGINPSGNILATSLGWPGNSDDYVDHSDPGTPPPGVPAYVYRGYAEVGDPTDKQLHGGDFVARDGDGFSGFGVTTALNSHIDENRALRMVLWDHSAGMSGGIQYHTSGFAIFKILGYSTGNWVLLQLVRIDSSCGQTVS
jgi:hypothetical protein